MREVLRQEGSRGKWGYDVREVTRYESGGDKRGDEDREEMG